MPEDLTLVCAANPYYEAENAAAYIWHLVRDLGYRMRDIQVIANDEGSMQPIVRRVFAEYGLPLFSDSTRDITDTAAVGFIVNLLWFEVYHRAPQFLFALLKSGMGGFSDEDIEELENYVRTYNYPGLATHILGRIGKISSEEYNKILEEGVLPASLTKIIEVDPSTGNFVSKAHKEIVIGNVYDIIDAMSNSEMSDAI